MTVEPRIRAVSLTKRYGDYGVLALEDVSLSVQPGEFVALMGPSGCGKSTLLNIVGTIDTPTAGTVYLEGQDVFAGTDTERTRLRRERMGFIFQFFNLLSTLTVRENVALPLDLDGGLSPAERRERVSAMLEQVGMAHRADFFPAQLSGGEMQRVAIARALVHEPAIVLADEPTGNLDTDNGARILELLAALCRDRGQSIVMATHSEEAAQRADRTVRMRDGRIVS